MIGSRETSTCRDSSSSSSRRAFPRLPAGRGWGRGGTHGLAVAAPWRASSRVCAPDFPCAATNCVDLTFLPLFGRVAPGPRPVALLVRPYAGRVWDEGSAAAAAGDGGQPSGQGCDAVAGCVGGPEGRLRVSQPSAEGEDGCWHSPCLSAPCAAPQPLLPGPAAQCGAGGQEGRGEGCPGRSRGAGERGRGECA